MSPIEDPQDPDHGPVPEDASWEESAPEEEEGSSYFADQPEFGETPLAPADEPYYADQPKLELEPPGRGRVVAGIVIAVVAALGFFVVIFGASRDWRGQGTEWAFLSVNTWAAVTVGILVLATLLVLTGLGGIARQTTPRAQVTGVEQDEETVMAEAEPGTEGWTPSRPESAYHQYRPAFVSGWEAGEQKLVFTYPEIARGGIFGDVDIPVGAGRKLKVRSRLVRPCTLCEERFVCWKEYKDRLTEEVFYSNYNCRPGLARLAAEAQASTRMGSGPMGEVR